MAIVKKENELWFYVMRKCSPKNRQRFYVFVFCKFHRIKYNNDVTKQEFSADQKYVFYEILEEDFANRMTMNRMTEAGYSLHTFSILKIVKIDTKYKIAKSKIDYKNSICRLLLFDFYISKVESHLVA